MLPRPADALARVFHHLHPLAHPAHGARHREQHGEHAGREAHRQQKLWTWGGSAATDSPTIRRVELTVGSSTLTFSPAEVATTLRALLPA